MKKRFPQNSVINGNAKSKNHSPVGSSQVISQNNPATDLRITDISCSLSPQSFSSCITAKTVAASNENLFLENEFAYFDADFWTEPFVTSEEAFTSLVTEPEYSSPLCDAAEIWSQGSMYEQYIGLF